MTESPLGDSFKSAAGWSCSGRQGWAWPIALAVLMFVGGFLTIAMPSAAGIGILSFFGWLIVFSGFVYLACASAAGAAGGFIWRTLIGLVYIVGGFYLIFNPGIALASLTFAVSIIFIAGGVLRIIGFFAVRSGSASGWILFDSYVTFMLGILIAYQWPENSGWDIGTIVGANLLVSGFTRLMYSVTARKMIDSTAR